MWRICELKLCYLHICDGTFSMELLKMFVLHSTVVRCIMTKSIITYLEICAYLWKGFIRGFAPYAAIACWTGSAKLLERIRWREALYLLSTKWVRTTFALHTTSISCAKPDRSSHMCRWAPVMLGESDRDYQVGRNAAPSVTYARVESPLFVVQKHRCARKAKELAEAW